jgi:hypothetical protein
MCSIGGSSKYRANWSLRVEGRIIREELDGALASKMLLRKEGFFVACLGDFSLDSRVSFL